MKNMNEPIPFSRPNRALQEESYLVDVVENPGARYDHKALELLRTNLGIQDLLLTTSCTHALELAILVAGIGPGDEVILPSFTFSSSANAIALRGATLVFIDVRPDTMNMDENLVEQAITDKTKAIMPVHYAGISCEMGTITRIATEHNLIVIEDAAQGIGAKYRDRPLGTLGDFGAVSFHYTKNLHCGEGGALVVKSKESFERAEIIREKGTNRSKFVRGEIDKYSWVDVGSSYVLANLNCAQLTAQLESEQDTTTSRRRIWQTYRSELQDLADKNGFAVSALPADCTPNGHIFFVLARSSDEANQLILFLKAKMIQATSHYVPLHSTVPGINNGHFFGTDKHTTDCSQRIVRLPLFSQMTKKQTHRVIEAVHNFYQSA